MNISNLYVGMELKNYKVLCNALGLKYYKSGHSKECQLKDLKRYCEWDREGQKFIITKIYKVPLEKIDKRHLGNRTGHYTSGNSTYKISKEFNGKNGVYIIQLNSDVYIGSTTNGFRTRYAQHYRNYGNVMPHTQNLLFNGGTFKILWVAPDNATELEIRQKEQWYINQYAKNEQYHLVNGSPTVAITSVRKKKINRKRILVDEQNLELAIDILKNNGILVY